MQQTKIQCYCSLHNGHFAHKAPPTHWPFCPIVWTCVWMSRLIPLWKPQCWEEKRRENTVETAGFVSLCFGHTWFIVLSMVLETPLNWLFPPLYRCQACWLWHEYPLSLFNISVIDSVIDSVLVWNRDKELWNIVCFLHPTTQGENAASQVDYVSIATVNVNVYGIPIPFVNVPVQHVWSVSNKAWGMYTWSSPITVSKV